MHEPLTTQLVGELLAELATAFPRNKTDANLAQLANVYRNGLAGLSGDSVREAVRRAIQADQYFPKVSRLREYAQHYDRSRTLTVRATQSEEWGVCRICGARVVQKPYYQPVRNAFGVVETDEKGNPVLEIAGYRDDLVHDRRAHGLYEQAAEGAA